MGHGETGAVSKFPYQKPNTDIALARLALKQRWAVPASARRRLGESIASIALNPCEDSGMRRLAARTLDGFTRTNLRAIETEAKVRAMETVDGPLTVRDMFAKLDDGLAAHEAKRALEATPEFQARQATQQAERNGVPRPRVPRLVRPDPRTS